MVLVQAGTLAAREQLDGLVTVLDLIRDGHARTRPELGRHSGLGRTVLTQRIAELQASGLVTDGDLGRSTGGRAPRELAFRNQAGHVLVAELGATGLAVGIADLTGRVLTRLEEPADIAAGPEAVLGRVEQLMDQLLADRGPGSPAPWGIGVGVPGPVEFAAGRPVAPPIMPGWDEYPIRSRLGERYQVPVWVDNEVNLMALGEFRGGMAIQVEDFVYVKVGTGIGAGLVSGGRLHRGAEGCAGDMGHMSTREAEDVVCRCGNTGCLEALAGAAALARDGAAAAADGTSPYLAKIARQRVVAANDVAAASAHGDRVATELLTRSGRLVGETLAGLVNLFNPSLVLVGGGVAAAGDMWLAAVRQAVYTRSLPLATRHLQIQRAAAGDLAGLVGAAFMVVDELFSRKRLGHWIGDGSPVGRPDVASL